MGGEGGEAAERRGSKVEAAEAYSEATARGSVSMSPSPSAGSGGGAEDIMARVAARRGERAGAGE